VEKDDEERQADNDQNDETQENIGAPRMFGLTDVVGAFLVPSHDSHGSIESLSNYNFSGQLLKKSLLRWPRNAGGSSPGPRPKL
jgi:hypothetical protein